MLKRAAATLRGYRYGLRSRYIKERPFRATINGRQRELFHSAFNVRWFSELQVVPKTIVDLGSFDGGDAYRFKREFPSARVVTVEADPTRFEIARENLSGEDIEIVNYAACLRDGDINWYVSTIDGEPHAQGSIYKHTATYQRKFPSVEQSIEPCTVRGRRFDTIAAELSITDIDLLHMDIEGAEHTVLQTLGNIRPRLIYLEWREGLFQGKASGPESENLLKAMNYKLVMHKGTDRLYFSPNI